MTKLRVFILPSWSPTKRLPHAGLFFVNQAEMLAKQKPEWIVGLGLFDFYSSRMPYNINTLKEFGEAFFSKPRFSSAHTPSGVHAYSVWKPWQRYWLPETLIEKMSSVLTGHARTMVRAFTKDWGKPHLIHAHAAAPGGAAAVRVGQEMNIPVVITEHMGPFPWPRHQAPSGHPRPVICEAYEAAKACAAVSSSLAKRLRIFGLAKEISVIPNVVDQSVFTPGLAARKTDCFSFFCVGGPNVDKGTDTLLRAFAGLPQNTFLSIAGNTPWMSFYQQLAQELGINARVQWLGNVPPEQMVFLYQECDAFVLPSRTESFGVSYVEALMCGKPVIATTCGGPEDIVNETNGLLVKVDDVDGLRSAMLKLCGREMAYCPKTIRDDAVARFGSDSVVKKLENFYLKVVEPAAS